MAKQLSERLADIVAALPLAPGMRVLEIGCGPGAMARELARRIDDGFVLGVDRSAAAIAQFQAGAEREGLTHRLEGRVSTIESFALRPDEERFDLAVAIRVGAFDGRHPGIAGESVERVWAALKQGGRFFIDGGDPLIEIRRSTGETRGLGT